MDAAKLIGELKRLGVELRPAGDKLRFRPCSAVTPEMRRELARHKSALIRLLTRERGQTPPYNCIRCQRPVDLVLGQAGDVWSYRCCCGNRALIAVRDYEKLRAFETDAGSPLNCVT